MPSTTLQTAINASTTDQAFIMLCEIDHASLSEPIRVANNWQDVVSNGNTYVAFPFEVTLPDDVTDQMPRPTLKIDNVDLAITDAVRKMVGVATVQLSVVLSSTPDTVEFGPFAMKLRKVEYDAQTVTGELAFDELWGEPFPGDTIGPNLYPSLF